MRLEGYVVVVVVGSHDTGAPGPEVAQRLLQCENESAQIVDRQQPHGLPYFPAETVNNPNALLRRSVLRFLTAQIISSFHLRQISARASRSGASECRLLVRERRRMASMSWAFWDQLR